MKRDELLMIGVGLAIREALRKGRSADEAEYWFNPENPLQVYREGQRGRVPGWLSECTNGPGLVSCIVELDPYSQVHRVPGGIAFPVRSLALRLGATFLRLDIATSQLVVLDDSEDHGLKRLSRELDDAQIF